MTDYMAPERTYRALQQGRLTYHDIYMESRERQAAVVQDLTVRSLKAVGRAVRQMYRWTMHALAVRRQRNKIVKELAPKDPRVIEEAGFSAQNLEKEAHAAAERIIAERKRKAEGYRMGTVLRFPVEARSKRTERADTAEQDAA